MSKSDDLKDQNEAFLSYRDLQEKLNRIKSGESVPDELIPTIINSLGKAKTFKELSDLFTNELKIDLIRRKE